MDNPQRCVGNGQMIGSPRACHLPVSRRIKDRIFCGQTSSSVGSGRAWAGKRSRGRDRKALMNLFLFSGDLSLLLLPVKKLFLSFQLLNLPHIPSEMCRLPSPLAWCAWLYLNVQQPLVPDRAL